MSLILKLLPLVAFGWGYIMGTYTEKLRNKKSVDDSDICVHGIEAWHCSICR